MPAPVGRGASSRNAVGADFRPAILARLGGDGVASVHVADRPFDLHELERQARARLEELEPLEQEAAKLRAVLAPMVRNADRDGRAPRGRPPGSTSGQRAELALMMVVERPGITVAELADAMGIGTSYLYRVIPALERDGKVARWESVTTRREPGSPTPHGSVADSTSSAKTPTSGCRRLLARVGVDRR